MANQYKDYEDQDFTAGDSPLIIDIEADTGIGEQSTLLINDGPGDILIAASYDSGATFGDDFKVKAKESYTGIFQGVNQVRITHTGVDTALRYEANANRNPIFVDSDKANEPYNTVNHTEVTLNSATYTDLLTTNKDRISYVIDNDNAQDVICKEKSAGDPDNTTVLGFTVFRRSVYESQAGEHPIGSVSGIATSGTPTVKITERIRL